MRRRMLNNNNDDLVDEHTRFLMRFDNNFKVDGYPPPNIEDGLEIKGGEFVTDSIRTGYKYTNTSNSYGMINTSSTLSPDLFGDGDPFTIDFWYKPLVVIGACSVGHEWYNGIFYFGITGDAGDLGLFFATQMGSYGGKASDAIIGRWYHIAMVRVNYTLHGFVDGKRSVSFPCSNISLRYSNIDFNRQRDGSNRASFVIDNFRISDVARWTSDFDPPK